jgi:hypothetical protein
MEWLVLIAAYAFFLSLFSPGETGNGAIHADFRYFSAIVPVCAGLVGACL